MSSYLSMTLTVISFLKNAERGAAMREIFPDTLAYWPIKWPSQITVTLFITSRYDVLARGLLLLKSWSIKF